MKKLNVKSQPIIYTKENDIAFLTLAQPPKNEMNGSFFELLNQLISEIESDKSIKALVLTSEGRHFSSGANVDELVGLFETSKNTTPTAITENKKSINRLRNFNIPVVACIKGICYGSGLELAMAAHFRISAEKTVLSLPETGFNIIPGLAGIYQSTKLMGARNAMEFVLADKTLSGKDAFDVGLIDILANKHNLITKAKQVIELIGNNYHKQIKAKYMLDYNRTYAE